MKIYTKRGDDGTTGLLYGGRVDKDDARTEAYGTTDEAVAALGLARVELDPGEWHDAVLAVQRELFVVGAQLATHFEQWSKLTDGVSKVTPEMIDQLEQRLDDVVERFPLPQQFVVPGGNRASAALDLARAIVRRAERAVAHLARTDLLPEDPPLRYLNRLADYLFVLARAVAGEEFTPTREQSES